MQRNFIVITTSQTASASALNTLHSIKWHISLRWPSYLEPQHKMLAACCSLEIHLETMYHINALQCFDTVVWASGRVSSL